MRVDTLAASDPEQLRSFLGDTADKLLKGLKPLTDQRVSGSGSLLLAPRTLDSKQSKSTRRVEFVMKIPNFGSLPITFTEEKESKEVPAK